VDLSAFYGLVSYAIGITLIMGLTGIKIGRRFFRHRSERANRMTVSPPQLPVIEAQLPAIEPVDLVPERRAPPPAY
jgi:hypothetical protein